jgi:hypothetical protein
LRCEICGAAGEQLHAHEVWDYIDASDAPGLDPQRVQAAIAKYKTAEQAKFDQNFATLNRIAPGRVHVCSNNVHSVECRMPASGGVLICIDFDPEGPVFPKVAILNRIQALCRLCHICKHYRCDAKTPEQLRSSGINVMCHWCGITRRLPKDFIDHYRNERSKLKGSLVVEIDYSGYDEFVGFKGFTECHP